MNAAIKAKLSPKELVDWKLLAAASTVESGNHSFAEALYSADYFLRKENITINFSRIMMSILGP